MKKLLMILLCAVMVVSCFCLTACGDKEDKNNETNEPKDDDTAPVTQKNDYVDPFEGMEKPEPVDVSKIEKAKGGDIVGKWISAEMLQYNVDPSLAEQDQIIIDYSIIFNFKEDGTCEFALSLILEEEPYKQATYSVDGGNLVLEGEGLNVPNATYTVDGDVLLINSDTLNCAFRRVID